MNLMRADRYVRQLCFVTLFGFWGSPGLAAETGAGFSAEKNNKSSELPTPRIERAVFLVEHEKGCGSGFLMQDGGRAFFVSNIHVLSGGKNSRIRNIYGETVAVPDQVEVASDRDLIRFQVSYGTGLCIAQNFEFGDEICAFGNSGGEGVVTRLGGKILALGPGLVEISSTIIPGNSGGPVLNVSNQIVGVSTYVKNYKQFPDWLIKDTRFEGTRRMAVRVDNVEWISMAWDEFQYEAECVEKVEDCALEMIQIVEAISSKPDKMIFSDIDHSEIQDWIQRYNQDVRKSGSRLTRVTTGTRISYKVSPEIERAYRKNLERLAVVMEGLRQEASQTGSVSTRFFKERLEMYRDYFGSCGKQVETVVETMF